MTDAPEGLSTAPVSPARASPLREALPRLALVGLVAVALLVAWRFGLLAQVADPKTFAHTVVGLGVWGYVAFVVAYALLQPFGVPGTVFVVSAALLWPWPIAYALSMTGTMAASVIGFSFARFVARDWVAKRVPARLKRYEAALERSAFTTVFVLRLVLWMPQALHAFLGVSKVPFWTHVWASLLGYALPLFVVSWLGAEMFDASGAMQPKALPVMGAMLALSVVVVVAWRRWDRRSAVAPAATDDAI